MSDLSPETFASPFAYCGVDYFRPFSVKDGHKEV